MSAANKKNLTINQKSYTLKISGRAGDASNQARKDSWKTNSRQSRGLKTTRPPQS